MIAQLRTFLTSRRRSLLVFVGCLAYVALVKAAVRAFPHVAPSLGHVWLIIVVLYFIAAYVVTFLGAYIVWAVVTATLTPIITRALAETPWAKRSDKAKEKLADSLLSISNVVFSALLIVALVSPFTSVLQAVVSRKDLWAELSAFLKPDGLPGWQVMLLIVLFFLPIVVSALARKNALDIYDELARPAIPEPPLGPNDATSTTRSCPASMDTPKP